MIRYGIIATVALLIAVAVTATFRTGETSSSLEPVATVNSILQGDLQQRLALLEATVRDEQQLRIEMAQKMSELEEQNQWLEQQFASVGQTSMANLETPTFREQFAERRAVGEGVDPAERTQQRLVEAGFDDFEAAEIVRITEELQMRRLNTLFEAEQSGERVDIQALQAEATQELKDRLGEADYEKFLEATRRPTSVAVRNVLESSPAQTAGLQSGDEIVRYNGERVYNINELNRLTNSTDGSGSVLVEVVRDGQTISVSLPAGPIGITSRSRGGGF